MVDKGRGGSARLDEPMVHGCGREIWTAAGYAAHARSCDGTAPKTEGRIAERQKALVAVHPGGRPRKPAVDEKTEHRRAQYRASKQRAHGETDRTPPVDALPAIQGAATDKAMEIVLAGLMAKRDRIDVAIAALRAVSA